MFLSNCGCCGGPCPSGSCTITIDFLDENHCEDDDFDFLLKNPTTGAERFIQTVVLASDPPGCCSPSCTGSANVTFPLEITETDFDQNCKVTFVLKRVNDNCCGTRARFRIIKPDNEILYGTYFGPTGLEATYTYKEICEPGPPPPPPGSCCRIDEEACTDADGNLVTVGWCDQKEPECCADAGYTQQECSVDPIPGVINCDAGGYETPENPPYDCTNTGLFDNGITFLTYNNDFFEIADDFGDEYASLADAVESVVNGGWVISEVCLSTVKETFPSVDIDWTYVDPESGDSSVETYTIQVSLEGSVCSQYARMFVSVSGPSVNTTIERNKDAITPIRYDSRCPINGIKKVCRCGNWAANWDEPAGVAGTIDMRPTPGGG